MRGGARTFAGWGLLLFLTATALFAFRGVDTESYALLFGAAGAVLAAGLALAWLARRGRPETDEVGTVRLEPDLSLASALLGVALFLLALSAVVGLWLALIAAGLLLAAAGGLLRERRAMRAERRGKGEARGGSEPAEVGPSGPLQADAPGGSATGAAE
jgi:hypothetical protein